MENDDFKINEKANRFEMQVQGQTAIIDYIFNDDVYQLTHIKVPENLEGKGHANAIVEKALNYIKDHNHKVAPLCSFVVLYISRHPQWDPIVTNGY